MRLIRGIGLVAGLALLAAAGAGVALLLLSTIGGTPEQDPVGRLRPVVPGLGVTTAHDSTTTPSTPTDTGADDDHSTTGSDDHGGRGDDHKPDEDDD